MTTPTCKGQSTSVNASRANANRQRPTSPTAEHFTSISGGPGDALRRPRREPTTTPVQQLFVLNSKFLSQQADRLYDRVKSMGETSTTARVRKIYEWMFARFPTPAQVELAKSFLASGSDHDATWTQYLHALLSSNEFAFVD